MENNKNNTFLCKIADLVVEIPSIENLDEICKEYIYNEDCTSNFTIDKTKIRFEKYVDKPLQLVVYLETGRLFALNALYYNGFYLHASAVELDGKAYLFSADCGTGKSTHTRNWQRYFGEKARVFNDDKPALRKIDGVWYAYGTPWCGKDHININMKVPLAGICFLKQAPHNKIRRLTPFEAAQRIILQTTRRFKEKEHLDLMLKSVDDIVSTIPIFELENLPDEEAVKLSYTTMLNAAKEAGL